VGKEKSEGALSKLLLVYLRKKRKRGEGEGREEGPSGEKNPFWPLARGGKDQKGGREGKKEEGKNTTLPSLFRRQPRVERGKGGKKGEEERYRTFGRKDVDYHKAVRSRERRRRGPEADVDVSANFSSQERRGKKEEGKEGGGRFLIAGKEDFFFAVSTNFDVCNT